MEVSSGGPSYLRILNDDKSSIKYVSQVYENAEKLAEASKLMPSCSSSHRQGQITMRITYVTLLASERLAFAALSQINSRCALSSRQCRKTVTIKQMPRNTHATVQGRIRNRQGGQLLSDLHGHGPSHFFHFVQITLLCILID